MPRVRRCRAINCHNLAQHPHYYCQEHIDQEQAYLDSRAKWTRAGQKEYRDKYNKQTRNRSVTKREQYAFYKSSMWTKSLRPQVLERDHHLCQYCLLNGKYTPGNTVDHVVPIEYDPTLKDDIANLATSCRDCHKLKTEWEQEYYGTGSHGVLKRVAPITDISTIAKLLNPPHPVIGGGANT